jgi:NAD(P)-dependent dehydrogenase (short-subunit alcohol dehydrogenase family)
MTNSTIDAPVWFVTGCSTGFGREFARAALAHGFRVTPLRPAFMQTRSSDHINEGEQGVDFVAKVIGNHCRIVIPLR